MPNWEGRNSPDKYGRFNERAHYMNGYEELVDHNTDWQVLHNSCAQVHSLIDPFPGKMDLEKLGRSLDRVTTWFQINSLCTSFKQMPTILSQWIVDSGASIHFTGNESDFLDLIMFPIDGRPPASTANGSASVHGYGAIFVKNTVTHNGKKSTNNMRLYPVYYMPGTTIRLMSMGQILQGNIHLEGDDKSLIFIGKDTEQTLIEAFPNPLQSETIYWVNSKIISGKELITHTSMHADDYNLWHRRLGHPSDQVLSKVRDNTSNFPFKFHIPRESPICSGCTKGKMHSRTFPENVKRATKPFERIHTDLKEYPVLSYYKSKWYISFVDDCTSHSWIMMLKKKSDAFPVTKQFLAMVKTQYGQIVKELMSDYGGEYVDDNFINYLKDQGIKIQRSVPYMHQINGRVERFNRTLNDKAQAMRQQACLPNSWWEFCVLHANYIYNHTPMRRLNWKTPSEAIDKEKPDLSHLRILGCGAYVFIPEEVRKNKLSPKSKLFSLDIMVTNLI